MQLRFDGADGGAQLFRDLFMLEAFDVMEHESLARAGRQCRDGPLEIHTRIGIVGCGAAALEGARVLDIFDPADAPAGGAAVLEHDIHGQPVQPGRELTFASKRAEPGPYAHEDILREPFRFLRVRAHAEADGVHPAHVLLVQDFEILAGANRLSSWMRDCAFPLG